MPLPWIRGCLWTAWAIPRACYPDAFPQAAPWKLSSVIFTAQGSAHLRFPMKIFVGRGMRIPIWEDPLFLCFLQEKWNGCTYTKRFYARFHSCHLGMNQFRSVPWDLQAKAATWELPSKQGCAGMGSLINSFLRVTLVLSVCRGCLGFLQGTCPNILMGPFSQSLSRFQWLRSYLWQLSS